MNTTEYQICGKFLRRSSVVDDFANVYSYIFDVKKDTKQSCFKQKYYL